MSASLFDKTRTSSKRETEISIFKKKKTETKKIYQLYYVKYA